MKYLLVLALLLIDWDVVGQSYPNSRDPENQILPAPAEGELKKNTSSELKFSHRAARKAFGKRQKEGKKEFRKLHRELDQLKIEYHKRMIYQIRQYRKIEKRSRKYKFSNPVDTCYPPGKYRPRKKIFR